MRLDTLTLRLRPVEAGLSRLERKRLGRFVFLAGLPFLTVAPVLGAAVWACGLLTIGATHALARRDAFRTGRVGAGAERAVAHLPEVLRTGGEALVQAVRRIGIVDDEVVVEFAPTADPGLRKVDGREVRCVLY